MADKLTAKQKKFADEYIKTGNAELSAKLAGYSKNTARGHAHKLLQNVAIRLYIEKRNQKIEKSTIANMVEVKEFWSNVFRDKEADMKDRLKATEYIAKTNAAFIDKNEIEIKELPQIVIKRGDNVGN
jgi:phage terminase small subunit